MSGRVLLVEDDTDLRELMAFALESDGYTVGTARNGVDALVQLEFGQKPDAVLLNLIMPVMPGLDVLEAIRRDPRLASIPVVLVTGAIVPADAERAADAVVQKPFEFAKLARVLARVIGRGAPPTPTPPPARP